MRTQVLLLALLSGLRIWHCHGLWCSHKRSSDLALLWLWYRPAATALIQFLAWELPCATGVALERQRKKKNNNIYLLTMLI